MTAFVDSSAWFAAADGGDRHAERAREVLTRETSHLTTDLVVSETWRLIRVRLGFDAAERFLEGILGAEVDLELVSASDLERAIEIGRDFVDQRFALVDRTSFSVMERLGITRVVSFDRDFFIFRFDRDRRGAFEVIG